MDVLKLSVHRRKIFTNHRNVGTETAESEESKNDMYFNCNSDYDSDIYDNYECIDDDDSDDSMFDTLNDIIFSNTCHEKCYNNAYTEIMFAENKLTVIDVLTMVMAFCLRFQVSTIARSALLNMIKYFAGPKFDSLNASNYVFSKVFDPLDDKIIYHYFCNKCNKIICNKCNQEHKLTLKSSNYFISIDLKYQLQMMLSIDTIKNEVLKSVHTISSSDMNNMKDVNDSELYKNINSKEERFVTYNYSTDGAPLTKGGKRAFWPLQILLNCLPPILRFRYILLAGVLVCKREPNSDIASLYFSKFLDLVHSLYKKGTTVLDSHNKIVNIKFCPLSCPVDTVCRPILQNRLQFNGFFGCSWCYIVGIYFKIVSDHRGVREDISLTKIPCIDMAWSFNFEHMHAILSGIDTQLFKKWTSDNKCKYKLKPAQKEIIEKRLKSIRPTQNFHRLPEAIKNRQSWKSSLIKNWNLYFSLPCLTGILDDEALQHYSLLINGLYTLLKKEISSVELLQVEKDFTEFVGFYEIYYGSESMTFNVHSLLHAVESVRKNGPLWSNSAFPFESNIYHLKKKCNGPNEMDQQMSKKSLILLQFKTGNVKYNSAVTADLRNSIFSYKHLSTLFSYVEDVVFVGRAKLVKESVSNIEVCIQKPFNVFHIEQIESQNIELCDIIPITYMECKILHMNLGNVRYLSNLANDFEIQ
ncbi:hypothetical protein TSAR_002640 [Trichomalopsis sarcophagae]|uniref:Uncharacterized protein n=1 Tax=Trichomalopsis sarcophagae TaxID=543379 RepID=A0A232EQQ5_9HYME|nr:hypothetical protein TSAR_002640 [Trichomalopsis sarcophagae]